MRTSVPGVNVRNSSIRIVFRYQGRQHLERLCFGDQALARRHQTSNTPLE